MVQVITDSTSDITPELAEQLGIRVVPIYVRFGDKTYRDGVDISPGEFYTRLISSPVYPATSQPNPEDFTNVYREYCEDTDGIVSIHVSSKISGTFNSATMAQRSLKSRCHIEVIDSQFNSAGLGLVVTAAARSAKSGAGVGEVIDEAKKAVNEVRMFGIFETMKYLARSGRVNKTIAAVSGILNVMPLLTFRDGEIMRAGLVRTVSKGLNRIYDFVIKNAPFTELTIVHSAITDHAVRLRKMLGNCIDEEKITVSELGAGLGVHGGPGVLLVALRRAVPTA
ncbi:MAG: DegV family protein [Dehalococcoidales bacterium]|nr:DegV family protein [Dehalococcoidales bacterium]